MTTSDQKNQKIFQKVKDFFLKHEKWFFAGIILLNLAPVSQSQFLPLVDAPAHLYNSQLVKSLINEPDGFLSIYYRLNPVAVPNWAGHFILTLLSYVFSWVLAEKILVLIYLIGFPLAFRRLIKEVSPNGLWVSYFAFPFSYSLLFLAGFYNFCLGILFWLIAFTHYLNLEKRGLRARDIPGLSILSLIVFFSHLFTFYVLVIMVAGRLFYLHIWETWVLKLDWKKALSLMGRNVFFLSLAALPSLILLVGYRQSLPKGGSPTYLPKSELISDLFNLRSLVMYNPNEEFFFTRMISFALLLGLLFGAINFRKYFAKRKLSLLENSQEDRGKTFYWLLLISLFLLLYFLLPNSQGIPGYISIRFSYFILVFCIIATSILKLLRWQRVILVLLILGANFGLNRYYSNVFSSLSKDIQAYRQISEYVEPYSTMLVIGNTTNWLQPHYSNYLGLEKDLVILYNYEASANYFPIHWNLNSMPSLEIGDLKHADSDCVQWPSNPENGGEQIDYILEVSLPEESLSPCELNFRDMVQSNFELANENSSLMLWKSRQ